MVKKIMTAALCFMILAFIPCMTLIPKAEYSTETDIQTEETTEEETDGPFIADISFDGDEEVGEIFSAAVFVVSDDLRGGTLVIRYDPAVLSEPGITVTDDEGFILKLKTEPGMISVLFITDESFYGYATLLTLDFSVISDVPPETVKISLENIVLTDGFTEITLSGVTYVAAYVPSVTETDGVVTTEPVTDEPATETETQIQTETETLTDEPVTTARDPVTTEPFISPVTETDTETDTQTDTETETQTDTEAPLTAVETTAEETTGGDTTSTEEAVITAQPTESDPAETGGEEKPGNSFIIPAVTAAAILAFCAATVVCFIRKTKKAAK